MRETIIDSDINFKLLKINAFGNNIVVSRTEILEQEKEDAYIEAVKNIKYHNLEDRINIIFGVFFNFIVSL